jgi:hypothetical protein
MTFKLKNSIKNAIAFLIHWHFVKQLTAGLLEDIHLWFGIKLERMLRISQAVLSYFHWQTIINLFWGKTNLLFISHGREDHHLVVNHLICLSQIRQTKAQILPGIYRLRISTRTILRNNIESPTQIFWELQITQPLLKPNNGRFGNYNSSNDPCRNDFYDDYYPISLL